MDLDFKVIDDTDAVLNEIKDPCQINFYLLNKVGDINHFWSRL